MPIYHQPASHDAAQFPVQPDALALVPAVGALHADQASSSPAQFPSLVQKCAQSSYLYKKSSGQSLFGRRNWQKRWFILDVTEPALHYADSASSNATVSAAIPHVKLANCLLHL
jgi:hypothetical protein